MHLLLTIFFTRSRLISLCIFLYMKFYTFIWNPHVSKFFIFLTMKIFLRNSYMNISWQWNDNWTADDRQFRRISYPLITSSFFVRKAVSVEPLRQFTGGLLIIPLFNIPCRFFFLLAYRVHSCQSWYQYFESNLLLDKFPLGHWCPYGTKKKSNVCSLRDNGHFFITK